MAMTDADDRARGVKAIRPCLPAKDFARSRAFHVAPDFTADTLGDGPCAVRRETFGFLLPNDDMKARAENVMRHVLVDDAQAGRRHSDALDLPGSFGLAPSCPPKGERWGLAVASVFDPSGLLSHLGQPTRSDG